MPLSSFSIAFIGIFICTQTVLATESQKYKAISQEKTSLLSLSAPSFPQLSPRVSRASCAAPSCVLLVGIDDMHLPIVEERLAKGELPHLSALRQRYTQRIPLLVSGPEIKCGNIDDEIEAEGEELSIIDVAPLILKLLPIDRPDTMKRGSRKTDFMIGPVNTKLRK